MAELTLFVYRPGTSPVHRLDARMKLVLVAAASLLGLRLDFPALGLMALTLAAVAAGCRRSLRIHVGELRWIALLLAFVCAARVVCTEGAPHFSLMGLDVTREGLREGALAGLRLGLVFLTGALLVGTTRSTEIKAGIQWFLKPLPFIPAARVGTMLGLLIRFLPVIFEEISRLSDAQRARAVENRRNPLQRLVTLGAPILSRVFVRSDRLALAMEARCYSEAHTPVALKASVKDWGAFALSCGWLAALLAV